MVALTDSPTPRFDLLKLERYSYVSLQFSWADELWKRH
jgi:hypothetical protein